MNHPTYKDKLLCFYPHGLPVCKLCIYLCVYMLALTKFYVCIKAPPRVLYEKHSTCIGGALIDGYIVFCLNVVYCKLAIGLRMEGKP